MLQVNLSTLHLLLAIRIIHLKVTQLRYHPSHEFPTFKVAMAARGFPFIKLELDEKHAKSFLYSIPSGPDLSSAIVLRLSEHSALDYNIINEKIGSQLGSLADRVVQRPDVEFREPIQCEVERRRSQRHTAGLEPITPPHYTEKVDGQPWNNVFGDRDAALSRVWAEEVISQQVWDMSFLKVTQLIIWQVLSTVIKQEDRQLSFNSISTSPTKRKLQKTERRANRSDPTDINTSPRKQSPSKGHITKDSRGIVFKRSPSVYGKALRLETKDRTLSITLEKVTAPLLIWCLCLGILIRTRKRTPFGAAILSHLTLQSDLLIRMSLITSMPAHVHY